MAAPKRPPAKREQDLDIISREYLTGRTQAEIAKRLNLSRQQIGYDLQELQKRWQESSLANTDANRAKLDAKKAEELAKIDALERMYWKAWRRSCKDREVQTAEKVTGDTARSKAATRREGQSGNPAFLAGVERCIDRRCKLLGLDAPRKLEHKHTLAAEDLTDEQLLAIAGSRRPDRPRGSGPGTPPPARGAKKPA